MSDTTTRESQELSDWRAHKRHCQNCREHRSARCPFGFALLRKVIENNKARVGRAERLLGEER